MPSGDCSVTLQCLTLAQAGPSRNHAIIWATASDGPSSHASTEPS